MNATNNRVELFYSHNSCVSFASNNRVTIQKPELIISGYYFIVSRLEPNEFEELLSMLEPLLTCKRNTHPVDGISPREKLAVVLEYFACGTLQRHIASVYRISKQYFGQVLDQVCLALCKALVDEIPAVTPSKMLGTANLYNARWNFPNCVGAVDGKHVAIKCPPQSGSLFYNYKGIFSIVLMAIADGNYKFVYVDIGGYGSEGDSGVFADSALGKELFTGNLKFPENASIGEEKIPFFFVADDAFSLHKHIMKPYSPPKGGSLTAQQQIFNYRLSRARRTVENAFGIMCSKFYCLARTMFCHPDRAQKIINACCYLHNYLIHNHADTYCPPNYADTCDSEGKLVEGEWRKRLPENSLNSTEIRFTRGRPTNSSKQIRDSLRNYVNSSVGAVPWQWQLCHLN